MDVEVMLAGARVDVETEVDEVLANIRFMLPNHLQQRMQLLLQRLGINTTLTN